MILSLYYSISCNLKRALDNFFLLIVDIVQRAFEITWK